jgi:3-oxo-5-alpha-steroid 4-dehydrogenase 1
MEVSTFYLIVYLWIACALVIFPFVLKITAPYGRHTNKSWGKLINNRVGWIIMESPALLVFGGFYLFGSKPHTPVTWIFFSLWMIHYVNRTLIFPFRLRTKGKKMPVSIVFMALGFNFMNGFINGYYLGSVADGYTMAWLSDPRFIGGILVFFAGMYINMNADNILIHLRKPGETGYVIPTGGFFRVVSCPNHFGEIVEWFGFALMCWSTPALSFAIWTLVNVLPRSLQHHQWYKRTFDNYPSERKAIIPFVL